MHCMSELEKFLGGDLPLALSNIRYFLANQRRGHDGVVLDARALDQLTSYLTAAENRALELAALYAGGAPAGIDIALRRISAGGT